MKVIDNIALTTALLMGALFAAPLYAQTISSLALHYDEVEKNAGVQNMRYLINQQFMRIDDGNDRADFILYDINKKTIYSVNHDDQTILKIENNNWTQPVFKFDVKINQAELADAPKIQNKTVYTYSVKAGKEVCTSVFLIKDMYTAEMKTLFEYQQVLSGQQVATLKNTPQELHTPCFLVDQVYHSGDYYKVGLPVKINYSRDYAKFLKDFKYVESEKELFKLPEKYQEYKAFEPE